jgi:hypothetical protein
MECFHGGVRNGRLGLREGAMVLAFSHAGSAASDALIVSILLGAGNFAIGLFGGIAWIASGYRGSRRARQAREPSLSVIVPCRNERGNIEAVVGRLPAIAPGRISFSSKATAPTDAATLRVWGDLRFVGPVMVCGARLKMLACRSPSNFVGKASICCRSPQRLRTAA